MLMFWSPKYEWKTSSLNICVEGGGGGGVVNDVLFTYTTYNITKKVFFGLLEFYTKPIILMSWYYLSAQMSAAAQLQPVFCKFQ